MLADLLNQDDCLVLDSTIPRLHCPLTTPGLLDLRIDAGYCLPSTKETIMVLKVDLDCPRCYKKVKKLLCQFPQIHDQVYNEKQNMVMIKVLCCSPEKIRDKLCCKGGKSIKSIEILEPKKPPPPPPPAEKPPPEKPAPAQPPPPVEKPKEEPSPPPPPPPAEPAPPPPPADPKPNPNPPEKLKKNGSKNGSRKNGSPKPEKPPEEAPPPPPTKPNNPEPAPEPKPDPPPPKPTEPDPNPIPQADPVQCYPVYQVNPVNMCCPECYAGHTTGPCYHGYGYGSYGYGVPPPPPAPPAGGWGYYGGGYSGYNNNYKPGYCVSRCGDYISDENPTACVIM